MGAALRRIARYNGAAVAVFPIARKLAQLVYRTLRYDQEYTEIGEKTYEQQFETRRLAALHEPARSPGYNLVPETGAA